MKKSFRSHLLALLLPLALLLSVGARAAEGEARAPLLERERVYEGQFIDADPTSWYFSSVVSGYEYGLFNGRGDGFAPNAEITVAELLTLSARLHAAYTGDTIPAAEENEPLWYGPYLLYLDEKGILDESVVGWENPATRSQLAAIFSLSLPEECYDGLNDALVTEGVASGRYIADVNERTPYQSQILWMYRQGLLAGMDDTGSYWPDKTTTRAEVAAVVTRIVDPSLRITLDWSLQPPRSETPTLASLIDAPSSVPGELSSLDPTVIDALVRNMLAQNETTIRVDYYGPYSDSAASTYARSFITCAKQYCEQMYNAVSIEVSGGSNGTAKLKFYATACDGETLAQYREQTMAKALEVRNELWRSGRITPDMSQYEIAKVYYLWLCDHCAYDHASANDPDSISHLAYAALIGGSAVCDGYTGAYNLFLKLEGIDCYALSNDTHIWTVARLDGTVCHIDSTWGDQESYVEMRFFGMTPEQSAWEHAHR